GMCEGGRVLHHLEHTLGDSRNIVLFVGYQAEHTLGRRLVDGITPVRIYGEEMDVRAEIHSIQALSAHADRNELLSYFKQMGPEVDQAFVVHGEPDQSEPFAEALKKLGAREVSVPARDTTVKV
ncbi:MAG TPA: MBL fold metallo-hydrolase, partial [Planctomycetes bacterium]|nr:MBL fold metallo-hydrolase [Planctomycetota bacterium]